MCFLISVWGLLSARIRRVLFRIQKRNTNKRQIWNPQLSQPEPWGKLGLFMQKCFLFLPQQVWKQLCGWESYTSYVIYMAFSPLPVSFRAVIGCCTTAGLSLKSGVWFCFEHRHLILTQTFFLWPGDLCRVYSCLSPSECWDTTQLFSWPWSGTNCDEEKVDGWTPPAHGFNQSLLKLYQCHYFNLAVL